MAPVCGQWLLLVCYILRFHGVEKVSAAKLPKEFAACVYEVRATRVPNVLYVPIMNHHAWIVFMFVPIFDVMQRFSAIQFTTPGKVNIARKLVSFF